MISEVFRVLKDALNDHIKLGAGYRPTDTTEEQVVFANANLIDKCDFKSGFITMLLVGLEEDRQVLPADPYRRMLADGTTIQVKAPVPLNIYILFVARYGDYLNTLRGLEAIVQFFQKYRVIDRSNMPTLASGIEKLVSEHVTMPVHEHNHIWGMLNTSYQPSILYRVRMVVFHDADGLPLPPTNLTSLYVESKK